MPDLKICIVDDDEDDRYFLREAVSEVIKSAQIVECSDGKEFLDFIQLVKPGDAPTLVLLDMNMPKINGLEVASFMQQHQQYKDIPLIMVSTSQNKELEKQAYSLGIQKYLVKPFSMDEYETLIREINNTVIKELLQKP